MEIFLENPGEQYFAVGWAFSANIPVDIYLVTLLFVSYNISTLKICVKKPENVDTYHHQ